MSTKENPKDGIIKKETYLDFEPVLKSIREREEGIDLKTFSKSIGYSELGLRKLRTKAPKVVSIIYQLLKEHDLKFEDLVKEID